MTVRRQAAGRAGERHAERFLAGAGYVILARNYRCPLGEIDLVALDRRTVVFVEVKARHGGACGTPLEVISPRQRRRIARAAESFLVRHRLHDRAVRFDVVGVWLEAGAPRCELCRDAFTADAGW